MDAFEFLLSHVACEASKIPQAVSGIQKFGTENRPHARDKTQLERLRGNVHELIAALECLDEELGRRGLLTIDPGNDFGIEQGMDRLFGIADRSHAEGILTVPITDHRLAVGPTK